MIAFTSARSEVNYLLQVYLRLHEKPVSEDDKDGDLNTENMDPSELKKLRNKQKKAKRKAEQVSPPLCEVGLSP